MLFQLYLLTTGASIATDAITLVDLFKRLKKEGYVINKEKGSNEQETLKSLIVVLSTIALPGYNAYFSYKFRTEADAKYELIKETLIERGLIREMTFEDIYRESSSFEPTLEDVVKALKDVVAQKTVEGYNTVSSKVESTVADLKENEKVQGALSAIDKKRKELLIKKELIKLEIQRAKEEAKAKANDPEAIDNLKKAYEENIRAWAKRIFNGSTGLDDDTLDEDKNNGQEGPKKR